MDAAFWIIVAVCCIAGPILAVVIGREGRRVRARERFDRGLCVKCGYDLHRNISERCPECGCAIEPPELPFTIKLQDESLAEEWPERKTELRRPKSEEERVGVFTPEGSKDQLDLLIDQLNARGVSTEVRAWSIWLAGGKSSGGHEAKYSTIYVWSEDVDRAIEIILGFSLERRRAR